MPGPECNPEVYHRHLPLFEPHSLQASEPLPLSPIDIDHASPRIDAIPTMPPSDLVLHLNRPVIAAEAGLFLSRGRGIHPDRIAQGHELIAVRRGTLHMEEDGRPFTVAAGETLVLWPDRRHRGTAAYDRDVEFYWLHFRVPSASGARGPLVTVRQQARPRRPQQLREYLHRYLDDRAARHDNAMAASLLAMLILCEVASGTPPGAEASAAAALAARAETWIATHFHDAISTSDVARGLGCNPDYLGRVFRSAHGHTIVDAIHRHRLEDARRLLIEGTGDIAAIAHECGYGNLGHFRRHFRRHTGLAPLAYRSLHTRGYVNSR